MSRFFNPDYKDLEPYKAGEQLEGITIKLNTNENPYPPDPATVEMVNADLVCHERLYEDPSNRKINKALAEYYGHGLKEENFTTCAGSDMMINNAFLSFGHDGVAYPDLSYGIYRIFSILHHMEQEVIPVKDDYTIDPADYFHKGKLICFANPNAPTGLQLNNDQIRSILETNRDHVVIVDEAYGDFGDGSCMPLVKEYDNLFVIRTFSKSFSLAGSRIGFGCGSPELIQDIELARGSSDPYDMTGIAQAIAISALKHADYYMNNVQKIIAARTYTIEELRKRGFFVTDSKTNFVFCHTDRMPAVELLEQLRRRGILVRHFDGERTNDFLRISIGTMEEMQAVMKTLDEILK